MIRRTLFPILAAFFLTACAGCVTDTPVQNNDDECDAGTEGCNVIQIESCDGPSDCPIGKSCKEGKCVSADAQCEKDEDCGEDRRCEEGICYAKERDIRPIPDMGLPDGGADAGDGGAETCNGCYLPSEGGADAGADAGDAGSTLGECVAGDTKEACGGGGNMCQTCEGEQLCNEGTCVDPPSCDETNCDGCCDGNECIENGTTDEACGMGGEACVTCNDPAVCDAGTGECFVPCNEDTCDGCCDDTGECVEGDQIDACGSGGLECDECDSAEQNCTNNTCVDKGCSETCNGCCDGESCLSGDLDGACGWFGVACVPCGDMTCEFGQCVVDENSRWDVVVISAEVPFRNTNNDTWDFNGGAPDPYVRLKSSDAGIDWDDRTVTKDNTTDPFYFETVLTDVPARALMDRLSVWVRDDDNAIVGDTTMGSCYSQLVQEDFDGTSFSINCPEHDDKVAVTIRLRLYPH